MQEKRVNRKAEDSVLRQGKSGQLTVATLPPDSLLIEPKL